MTDLQKEIIGKIQNCSLQLPAIQECLTLLQTQQKQYTDLSYHANSEFALVLKAKKNGQTEIALKVKQCDGNLLKFETVERQYENLRQLSTQSDYFVSILDHFYLTQLNEADEQGSEKKDSKPLKRFLVQELELCQSSLKDLLQKSKLDTNNLTQGQKETFAIQMFDIINLLHQKQIIHRDLQLRDFLVSQDKDSQFILKLILFHIIDFPSPRNPSSEQINYLLTINQQQPNSFVIQNNKICSAIEFDLYSIGIVLLQIDQIISLDTLKLSVLELQKLQLKHTIETNQQHQNSLLFTIASSLLQQQPQKRESLHIILLELIGRQQEYANIPIFSMVFRNSIDSFFLPNLKQNETENEFIKLREENKLILTADLIKSALKVMFSWREFGDTYDLLKIEDTRILFGVENIEHKRTSVLELQQCTNKAKTLSQIGVRKICQTPYIVKLYGFKFFEDAENNQFVVFELERTNQSLSKYLERQRIEGEYSNDQKYLFMQQMMDSVNFLHENNIIHRNLNLDSFQVVENEEGKTIVKLSDLESTSFLQCQVGKDQSCFSSRNRNLAQQFNPSQIYCAPEKQRNHSISTYQADCFSVGIILIFLDNYLVLTEPEIFQKLVSSSQLFIDIFLEKKILIDQSTKIYPVAMNFLHFLPEQRSSMKDQLQKLEQSCIFYSIMTVQDEFQQYFSLNLPKHKLKNSFEKINTLTDLSNLSLDLSRNQQIQNSTEQQSPLFPLTNLTHLSCISLNLSGNKFGGNGTWFILSPLKNLQNLIGMSLDMIFNQIGNIGSQHILQPLNYLTNLSDLQINLSNNLIGEIGAEYILSFLTNLVNLSNLSIDLSINTIGDIGSKSILQPLINFSNLTTLSLQLLGISIGDIGAEVLLTPLENLSNLLNLSLNLSHNKIGNLGASTLLLPLKNLTNLVYLTISINYNKIEDNGAKYLLSPLINLVKLTNITINLRDNYIGQIGAQCLLEPLANCIELSNFSLQLCNNLIGDKDAQFLLIPLENLINLLSLSFDLSDNSIGDIGAKSILMPLSKLINLSDISLDLSKNQIGDIGTQFLLSPLTNLVNLSSISINLFRNQIGYVGAQSLLAPLTNHVNLLKISLNLYSNQIGSIGAVSLLAPLSNLVNLSAISLNVCKNEIGQSGASSLLIPLSNLSNLQSLSLDIEQNKIGDTGAYSLLSPLHNLRNCLNLSLNLADNTIGQIGAQQLLSPLQNLINLSSLSLILNNNSIGEVGAKLLLDPLSNLINLSNISLQLWSNSIGDNGVRDISFLSPFSNLLNISSLTLNFSNNQIGNLGAQQLLSPLRNLFNLSNISLNVFCNSIGDNGVESLLIPLYELPNLQSIYLNLFGNSIGDIGVLSLIYPLTNLNKVARINIQISRGSIQNSFNHLFQAIFKNLEHLSISIG